MGEKSLSSVTDSSEDQEQLRGERERNTTAKPLFMT